jgi:hypothetical protein
MEVALLQAQAAGVSVDEYLREAVFAYAGQDGDTPATANGDARERSRAGGGSTRRAPGSRQTRATVARARALAGAAYTHSCPTRPSAGGSSPTGATATTEAAPCSTTRRRCMSAATATPR